MEQANQYIPDPRQTLFLASYLDPKSDTFSNAKKSAIKAGYANEYAENIMSLMPDWLSDSIERRKRMLHKAENRLEKHIESKDEKVSLDASKFIAKTLGKNEGYSERTEHTGKDGEALTIKWDDNNDTVQTEDMGEATPQDN